MQILNHDGSPISSWQDWVRPMRDNHWKEDRSAMELAKAWFRGAAAECPVELDVLLQSASFLQDVRLLVGHPEYPTQLPERGGKRVHDLYIQADSTAGPMTICVEAKADESFGNILQAEVAKARNNTPNTRMPNRARQLIQILTGVEADPEQNPWKDLRYQLLTGLAGTALQAIEDCAETGVFIIHEFVTRNTRDECHARNSADLTAFLQVLSPTLAPLGLERFWGPLVAHTQPRVKLYVAKVVTNLRAVQAT